MRKEYLEKLLELTADEKMLLETNEIGAVDKASVIKKNKYFYNLHKNITYVPHSRFTINALHGHEFVEMMYVINGSVTHIINGKEICINAGDIIIMNRYVKHEVKMTHENDLAGNFVFLPEFFDEVLKLSSKCKAKVILEFIYNILKDDKRPQYMIFETKNNVAVQNLLEIMMLPYILKKDTVDSAQLIMSLIFIYLADSYTESSDIYKNTIMSDLIVSYINNNYKEANLDELSRLFNKPVPTLSKYIKNVLGCKFNELLKRKRFQQAAIFLVETDMSIAEIMNSVGYENSSYFYNEFKKRFGKSPADFRKTNRSSDKIPI